NVWGTAVTPMPPVRSECSTIIWEHSIGSGWRTGGMCRAPNPWSEICWIQTMPGKQLAAEEYWAEAPSHIRHRHTGVGADLRGEVLSLHCPGLCISITATVRYWTIISS